MFNLCYLAVYTGLIQATPEDLLYWDVIQGN